MKYDKENECYILSDEQQEVIIKQLTERIIKQVKKNADKKIRQSVKNIKFSCDDDIEVTYKFTIKTNTGVLLRML